MMKNFMMCLLKLTPVLIYWKDYRSSAGLKLQGNYEKVGGEKTLALSRKYGGLRLKTVFELKISENCLSGQVVVQIYSLLLDLATIPLYYMRKWENDMIGS